MAISRTDTIGMSSQGRLSQLYAKHSARAWQLGYLLTRDANEAEDLVQDAFIRVAGKFLHLREETLFDAYLKRTIINLHISHLRRRRVERRYLRGQAGRLDAPASQRSAVVLRYCLDLSIADVADAIGCSVPAAKNLLARGLGRLRGRRELRTDE
jgi:DNA-directed RNA polymerase specialized sigma24 family protein